MSDTPETDAAIKSQSEWKLPFVSYTMGGVTYDGPVATLCRKLERERDIAKVAIGRERDEARDRVDELTAVIKGLRAIMRQEAAR